MLFIWPKKLFLLLGHLNFCSDSLVMIKKAEENFKIYDYNLGNKQLKYIIC